LIVGDRIDHFDLHAAERRHADSVKVDIGRLDRLVVIDDAATGSSSANLNQ